MLARFEVMKDDCSACALCKERAPENMEIVAEEVVARVVAQPSNHDEERACLEAADYCPMGALSVISPEPLDVSPPTAEVSACSQC